MVDLDMLARWLIACQKRPDPDRRIPVSPADAIALRKMGFWNVEPGRWRVPALPPELIWRYPALEAFSLTAQPIDADGQSTTPPPTPRADAPVVQLLARVTATPAPVPPPSSQSSNSPPPLPDDHLALTRQLRSWWLCAPATQQRVLRAIVNTPDTRIRQRQLRKRHRRLDAPTFRAALRALQTLKIVTVETVQGARWVVLRPAARQAFAALGLGGGRQAPSPRALTSARQRRSGRRDERPQPARQSAGQRRRRRTPPAPLTDREVLAARRRSRRRKPIPPRGTPEWRRHMCALKWAYASHRACHARGIVQTAKATQVRLANQRRRREHGASAGRVSDRPAVVSSAVQSPGNAHAPVSAPLTTASSLSAAWRSLTPIGRDTRLAEGRRRR